MTTSQGFDLDIRVTLHDADNVNPVGSCPRFNSSCLHVTRCQ